MNKTISSVRSIQYNGDPQAFIEERLNLVHESSLSSKARTKEAIIQSADESGEADVSFVEWLKHFFPQEEIHGFSPMEEPQLFAFPDPDAPTIPLVVDERKAGLARAARSFSVEPAFLAAATAIPPWGRVPA